MPAFLMVPASILLILAGMIVAPLPIPFGIPMIVIGITILIAHSPMAARAFANLRRRWTRFDDWIRFLEEKAPAIMAEPLRRTRPEGVTPEPPHPAAHANVR